ncbi:MAG: hypothetical protein J7518_13285 [Nocardioidaceae bacterium]|nr:hypothetical protein [Nocardioidaceae bacterium]
MSTVTRPRGRHPASVYWARRIMVVLTALALVYLGARALGGGSGNGSGNGSAGGSGDQAEVVAGKASGSPTSTTSQAPRPIGPVAVATAGGVVTRAPSGTPTGTAPPVVLAAPTGPCSLDEISVTPTIATAPAGRPVPLTLQLTGMRPACTFVVSSRTLAAKVISGKDRIWTSQQCPRSIRQQSVVVRSAAPTTVTVSWSGRRSDPGCTRSTSWALPGYYHVTAAVIGSEPGDAQFRLTSPPRPVVTKTVTPKPKPKP